MPISTFHPTTKTSLQIRNQKNNIFHLTSNHWTQPLDHKQPHIGP